MTDGMEISNSYSECRCNHIPNKNKQTTMREPKYLSVLLRLYESKSSETCLNYVALRSVIFSAETVAKYNRARRHKVVIDYMVCNYMGRLARKGYVRSVYENGRFQGYRICESGIRALKDKSLI